MFSLKWIPVKGEIWRFIAVALANIILAGPIGYCSFSAVGSTIASTPFGVVYKGDPDIYKPYDPRELVAGEISVEENSAIVSTSLRYGASLGMLAALIASCLLLFIEYQPDNEEMDSLDVHMVMVLACLLASLVPGFAATIVLHRFWYQQGINANWVEPLFSIIAMAAVSTLVGMGVSLGYYKAKKIYRKKSLTGAGANPDIAKK